MSAEYNFRFRIDWNVPRFDLDLTAGFIGQVKVLGYPVVGNPSQEAINTAVAEYIEAHPGSLSPLSSAVKAALLQIAEKVAYIDAHGDDYYNALEAALDAKALLQITAVYTQSGTVYDSASLDSLKPDLVVTAYYDDGTSAVIASGYTLSGTLEVGTSTITVTYEGKTATFNVTVTSYKEKMFWSFSSGDLSKVNAATTWNADHGAYLTITGDGDKKRRSFAITKGERPLKYTTDAITFTDSIYYPIPIPTSATKVTVSITPSTQYHGEAFYNLVDGEYTRLLDPGWKQGSFTHTFTAGAYEYMSIGGKMNSSGTAYTVEPTELTVTFE